MRAWLHHCFVHYLLFWFIWESKLGLCDDFLCSCLLFSSRAFLLGGAFTKAKSSSVTAQMECEENKTKTQRHMITAVHSKMPNEFIMFKERLPVRKAAWNKDIVELSQRETSPHHHLRPWLRSNSPPLFSCWYRAKLWLLACEVVGKKAGVRTSDYLDGRSIPYETRRRRSPLV